TVSHLLQQSHHVQLLNAGNAPRCWSDLLLQLIALFGEQPSGSLRLRKVVHRLLVSGRDVAAAALGGGQGGGDVPQSQQAGLLFPGTLVATSDGLKRIDYLLPGDRMLSGVADGSGLLRGMIVN